VPASPLAARSSYVKVRDRESFEFALVSAAVAIVTAGDRVREARVAVGGVGTRPRRLRHVEQALIGSSTLPDHLGAAAQLALAGATPLAHNGFKLALLPRAITRALERALERP
jgi:xanthine dehydrogenase YagS FAD-binding subunit